MTLKMKHWLAGGLGFVVNLALSTSVNLMTGTDSKTWWLWLLAAVAVFVVQMGLLSTQESVEEGKARRYDDYTSKLHEDTAAARLRRHEELEDISARIRLDTKDGKHQNVRDWLDIRAKLEAQR